MALFRCGGGDKGITSATKVGTALPYTATEDGLYVCHYGTGDNDERNAYTGGWTVTGSGSVIVSEYIGSTSNFGYYGNSNLCVARMYKGDVLATTKTYWAKGKPQIWKLE